MTYEQEYEQAMDDLHYEIARLDLEYADNYRVYRYKDRAGFRKYRERELRGCCGSFESSTIVNGKKWIIGCNYGH